MKTPREPKPARRERKNVDIERGTGTNETPERNNDSEEGSRRQNRGRRAPVGKEPTRKERGRS
jgi:hypothetical protein